MPEVEAKPALLDLFADGPFADLEDFDEQLVREKALHREPPDFDQQMDSRATRSD